MSSFDLSALVPDFQKAVAAVLKDTEARGFKLKPYFGVRDCMTQAKLWRQGRAYSAIESEILRLRNAGANYLADCLHRAGPQSGGKVTNALPGYSWHQWGEAIDCYWDVNGKANWDGNGEGYRVYAEIAKSHGLQAGFYWAMKDSVHIQMRYKEVPALYTPVQVDAEMRKRFGSSA